MIFRTKVISKKIDPEVFCRRESLKYFLGNVTYHKRIYKNPVKSNIFFRLERLGTEQKNLKTPIFPSYEAEAREQRVKISRNVLFFHP